MEARDSGYTVEPQYTTNLSELLGQFQVFCDDSKRGSMPQSEEGWWYRLPRPNATTSWSLKMSIVRRLWKERMVLEVTLCRILVIPSLLPRPFVSPPLVSHSHRDPLELRGRSGKLGLGDAGGCAVSPN
jgi:hypothetical protein